MIRCCFDTVSFSQRWPPSDVAAFQRWLGRQMKYIPAEYRASARIEFTVHQDEKSVRCRIEYERPDTQAEIERKTSREQALIGV